VVPATAANTTAAANRVHTSRLSATPGDSGEQAREGDRSAEAVGLRRAVARSVGEVLGAQRHAGLLGDAAADLHSASARPSAAAVA